MIYFAFRFFLTFSCSGFWSFSCNILALCGVIFPDFSFSVIIIISSSSSSSSSIVVVVVVAVAAA
jgi:hypothetical protein